MLVSDETQVAYKRWIGEMGSTQRCIVPILEGKFRELRHLFFEMPRCKKSLENDLCLEFSLQCNPEIGWEKIVNWAEIEGSNFLPWLGGHCLSIPEMQECCVASRLS